MGCTAVPGTVVRACAAELVEKGDAEKVEEAVGVTDCDGAIVATLRPLRQINISYGLFNRKIVASIIILANFSASRRGKDRSVTILVEPVVVPPPRHGLYV